MKEDQSNVGSRRWFLSKRTIIKSVLLGLIGFAAVLIWFGVGSSKPNIKGQFTPEDIRQIKQVVQHDRWTILGSTLKGHSFQWAFNIFVADVVFGRVVEIGPCDPPFVINGVIVTNGVGAYLLSRGCLQKKTLRYELARTTAGWKVTEIALPRSLNPRVERPKPSH